MYKTNAIRNKIWYSVEVIAKVSQMMIDVLLKEKVELISMLQKSLG
jgi:hypothetical protein